MSLGGFSALWAVLLVFVGGWLSLQSRLSAIFIWSESGYNLYFRIAAAGLLWLLVSLAGVTMLIFSSEITLSCSGKHQLNQSDFFVVFFRCHEEIFKISSWATPFVGLLVLATCSPWAITKDTWLAKKRLAKIAGKNELERLVKHAIDENLLLLVTLDSRKSYVGWPADTFNFSQPDTTKKHLRILPLLSGYRDADTMRLVVTTDYLAALTNSPMDRGEWQNLKVVIPVDKITTLQEFDLDLYDLFQQKTPPQIKDPPPPRNSAPPPGWRPG